MRVIRFFVISLMLCICEICMAQADCFHVELQAGYEFFHGMSNKSGYDFNIGCRYAFDDRYYAALMLHGGINNGSYKGVYAGETTKLDHTMREYMLGVGPGFYLYNGGNRWIYADIIAGYGFGEELKSSEDSMRKSLDGFASAVRLGLEWQLDNGLLLGVSTGGYLVGERIRPAVNLKFGFFLDL